MLYIYLRKDVFRMRPVFYQRMKKNNTMKSNLFRCFVLSVVLALAALAAGAAPQKEIVLVDYFTRSLEVPVPYMEAVRGNVLAGFADRGRHEILDAESVRELDPYRKSEAEREESIRATGARYVVTGAVTDYVFRHETVGGKPRFVSALRLVLSGVDLKTGKTIEPEEFKLTGQGATAEEADAKALGGMQYSLLFYIDRRFKFESRVLRLAPLDAKGRQKELYIRCGDAMGVQRKDLFLVYLETDMDGAVAREQIGKLRVKEVLGDEVTKCTVVKGGEQIAAAFAAGRPLVVVSDSESLF